MASGEEKQKYIHVIAQKITVCSPWSWSVMADRCMASGEWREGESGVAAQVGWLTDGEWRGEGRKYIHVIAHLRQSIDILLLSRVYVKPEGSVPLEKSWDI